jgi:hypothetical protein
MRSRLLSSGLASLAAGTLLLAAGPLHEPLIREDRGPSEIKNKRGPQKKRKKNSNHHRRAARIKARRRSK